MQGCPSKGITSTLEATGGWGLHRDLEITPLTPTPILPLCKTLPESIKGAQAQFVLLYWSEHWFGFGSFPKLCCGPVHPQASPPGLLFQAQAWSLRRTVPTSMAGQQVRNLHPPASTGSSQGPVCVHQQRLPYNPALSKETATLWLTSLPPPPQPG